MIFKKLKCFISETYILCNFAGKKNIALHQALSQSQNFKEYINKFDICITDLIAFILEYEIQLIYAYSKN